MNNLKNITSLKNRYFIIRHGESEANKKNIIISNSEVGIYNFGLTEKGKKEIKNSISKNKDLDNKTIIYSSDFLRTKETAEIIKNFLNISSFKISENLRERNFKKYEKTSIDNYQKVWNKDLKNVKIKDIESIDDVLNRTTKLIVDLEKKYQNKKILLVSHGDPLQILQTGFLRIEPKFHRKVKHLKTGEIRELILNAK